MAEKKDTVKRRRRKIVTARMIKWCVVAVFVIGLAWLATWLLQRSLRTPAKKRAMQSWLDENLNADVSLLGDMSVRVNLVRQSRLVFHNTEIEHPNPIFPGKFARIGRMGAWAQPWAVLGVAAGRVSLLFNNTHFLFAQNESGEWSHQGLLQPLSVSDTAFPFPLPKVRDWRAEIQDSSLTIDRRGYELACKLGAHVAGRPGSDSVGVHVDDMDFTFGAIESPTRYTGSAGPIDLQVRLGDSRGERPIPVPGRCAVTVQSLPAAMLPFFLDGFPMEDAPGAFHGQIRYDSHDGADGVLVLDGDLNDVPLAVFGLPRNNPLRVTWPVGPNVDNLQAQIHMGPAGFGAFSLTIPLDENGRPTRLSMRGDIAALDGIPAFFTQYSRWPEWLSRMFPTVEWRTGSWRGFGWSGTNLQLVLTRSTAGLNLTGEGEMLGGRVRLAMSPDQELGPITVAAERLGAEQLSAMLGRLVPEQFRARISGAHVNLTWRGFPSADGGMEEWGTGMVWAKPVIDVHGSGRWWRLMEDVSGAVAAALPEWGGGDPTGLLDLSDVGAISLDQMSIVAEREAEGGVSVEFRAYGGAFGQATGIIERRRDGTVEGEFLLAGPSRLLQEVERANEDLALALDLLANDSPGLRVSFTMVDDGEVEFAFPFLDDARRIHEEMLRSGMIGP